MTFCQVQDFYLWVKFLGLFIAVILKDTGISQDQCAISQKIFSILPHPEIIMLQIFLVSILLCVVRSFPSISHLIRNHGTIRGGTSSILSLRSYYVIFLSFFRQPMTELLVHLSVGVG
jgi:hypothetical protein